MEPPAPAAQGRRQLERNIVSGISFHSFGMEAGSKIVFSLSPLGFRPYENLYLLREMNKA